MSQQPPPSQRGTFWFLPRRGPAITLGIASLVASGAVVYCHYAQVREKEIMRAGVERDKERVRRIRRKQRDAELASQQTS
jgi:hypothetical protein